MKVPRHDKFELLTRGDKLAEEFCESNTLSPMLVVVHEEDWLQESAAYWQNLSCHICPRLCKAPNPGWRTRNWNWPGATTDRTPFGMVLRQLGHHVDFLIGEEYSAEVLGQSKEKPLTLYSPTAAEWFVQMLRLFVANPELLRELRPKTYTILSSRFYWPIKRGWREALGNNVPDHIVSNIEKKILGTKKSISWTHR